MCLYISGSPPQIETIGASHFFGSGRARPPAASVADGVFVFDDPAASDAGEIARMQRLEHQDQRKVLFAARFSSRACNGRDRSSVSAEFACI